MLLDLRHWNCIPGEAEEQRVDLLPVISEPSVRWCDACSNFHHFDIQSRLQFSFGWALLSFVLYCALRQRRRGDNAWITTLAIVFACMFVSFLLFFDTCPRSSSVCSSTSSFTFW